MVVRTLKLAPTFAFTTRQQVDPEASTRHCQQPSDFSNGLSGSSTSAR